MFKTLWHLTRLVWPLVPVLLCSVLLGLLGFAAVTVLMLAACCGVLLLLGADMPLNLTQTVWLMCSAALLRGVLRYGEQLLGHYVAFKLLALLRQQIFAAVRRQTHIRLNERGAGQWVQLLGGDVELIEVFYAHTLAPVLIALSAGMLLVGVLAWLAWPLGAVALAAYVAIGVLLPGFWGRRSWAYGRRYRRRMGALADYFLDSVRGIREVVLLGQADARLQALAQHSAAAAHSAVGIRRQEAGVRAATELLLGLFNLLMLLTAVLLVWRGTIGFDTALLAVVALLSAYGPVLALGNLSVSLPQTLAAAERVLALVGDAPAAAAADDRPNPGPIRKLRLEGVDFAYRAGVPVLENMALEACRGEIVGIYGDSGCGKSTLLQLVMGLLEAQAGRVLVNGQPLSCINAEGLRAQMVYCNQHTYLFRRTVYDNIAMADRNAGREAVMAAARQARIHEVIMALPDGYETVLSEAALPFSEGERQRIGLARAFLHPGSVWLMDEPTGNLDSLNEAYILQLLQAAKADKLIILVSHRLSTLAVCDRIVRLSAPRPG